MPPIRDGLYYSTIQYGDTVQRQYRVYGTEFSQRCKVYAGSRIHCREKSKKNARLARSRAIFLSSSLV
jgi:hypothetical protein